jgi:inner membrane protein
LATALVAVILAADLLWGLLEDSTGSIAYGLVDEPAHLATCALALLAAAAAGVQLSRRFVIAALVASMAIDLDHLPHYLGSHLLMGSALPRPYTHSLLFALLLLGLGLGLRNGARQVCLGACFGVGAHLFRDLATGPGVSLFWPLSAGAVTIPYAVYAAALLVVAATLIATARRGLRRRRPARLPLAAPPLPNAGPPSGS